MGAVVGQAYQPVERVADVATLNLALGERVNRTGFRGGLLA